MATWFSGTDKILGLNERSLKYLKPFNKKRARLIADDKLLTKRICREANINTAEVYSVIRSRSELQDYNWDKLPNSFVVKPRKGYGGAGILVVFGRNKKTGNWVKADKTQVSPEELKTHIANIIDGTFSLKKTSDYAIIEERVKLHPVLKRYAFRGIPDVRIISFNQVPTMAMLRLPTKESDGKANLDRGGVGVGIDLTSGITTNAIQHAKLIERHPDTRMPLSGIAIPHWKEMLKITTAAQIHSKLGFMGIDIALDREQGPMVFELNARPGLKIQICNLEGLKGRLKRIRGLKVKSASRGVRLARDLFGGEVEEGVEEITGKQVIGPFEYATFYNTEGKKAKIAKIKIDTGAYLTSIDKELAFAMGHKDAYKHFSSVVRKKKFRNYKEAREARARFYAEVAKHKELIGLTLTKSAVSNAHELRPVLNIEYKISGVRVKAKASIADRERLRYRAILGRRALRPFLIDLQKKPKKPF